MSAVCKIKFYCVDECKLESDKLVKPKNTRKDDREKKMKQLQDAMNDLRSDVR